LKRFLIHNAFFFFILVALNAILLLAAKELYFGDYREYSLEYNSYLLADSRGIVLQDLTEKYGVYNFSVESDSYFDMYRKIDFLSSRNRIDTIYISVDDHTLSPYRETNNNLDRSVVFTTAEDHDNYYEFFKARYLEHFVVLFQPKTRSVLRRFIFSEINNALQIIRKTDPVDEIVSWAELSDEERQNSANNRLRDQFPTDIRSDELQQSLEDIINVCRNNNIVLIGVKFPLSNEYNDVLGTTSFGADEILRKAGCEVIDYRNVYINHNEYFDNVDHLNDEGCYLFVELMFSGKENHSSDKQ